MTGPPGLASLQTPAGPQGDAGTIHEAKTARPEAIKPRSPHVGPVSPQLNGTINANAIKTANVRPTSAGRPRRPGPASQLGRHTDPRAPAREGRPRDTPVLAGSPGSWGPMGWPRPGPNAPLGSAAPTLQEGPQPEGRGRLGDDVVKRSPVHCCWECQRATAMGTAGRFLQNLNRITM